MVTIHKSPNAFLVITVAFVAVSIIAVAFFSFSYFPTKTLQAAGNTFYVDGVNGNDNNNGTTLGTAWRTIAKANTTHTGGDTVLIYPGVYREQMIPKSGTAPQPTIFRGVGDKSQILILGSDAVTGWQLYSSSNGNIYRAEFQAPQQCRYSGGSYTVNNTNCWINRTTWLQRADPTVQTDSLAALNAAGEYYYDQASQYLYVRMPDDSNPTNSLIECSKRPGIWTGEYTPNPPLYHFVLDNVTLMQTNGRAISLSPYSGGAGDVTIQNSEIAFTTGEQYCFGNPAAIYNGSATGQAYLPDTPGWNVLNNVIHDTGSDAGPGVGDWRVNSVHTGAGIEWYGVMDSRIEGNTFYNSAQPIAMKRGDIDITIKDNVVYNSREGIWLGWPTATGQFAATISGNTFYDIISNANEAANGIAIFNGCGDNRYNVYNNTLVNTAGIHNTYENDAQGGCNLNNVFMTAKNNIISNLVPTYAGTSGTRYLSFYWNSIGNVVSNRNLFYHPSTPDAFAASTTGRKALNPTFYNTIAAWRTASNEDANSIQGNPLFVNAAAKNFQLQGTSPGIDQGEIIAGFHCAQSDDVNPSQTNCRHWNGSAPDLGAFEYGSGTPDTTAPTISSVSSSSVGTATATVTWTTNEGATSQVEYGTTVSYGSTTTLDSSYVTSHSQQITGLSPATTYHYRVLSRDGSSNLATGSDNTFTTAASDGVAPTVSVTAPANGATVSGSVVTFSATASDNIGVAGVQFRVDGVDVGAEDTSSPFSITWNTTSFSNAAHTLTARARDAAGNQTTSASISVTIDNSTQFAVGDRLRVTALLNVRDAAGGTIIGNHAADSLATIIGGPTQLNGYTWWQLNYDTDPDGWSADVYLELYQADATPPVISAVTAGTLAATSATITWTTNEPADSQIQYGLTASYGSTTTLDTNRVTSHSHGISGLTASTLYHYRVVSKDARGNSTTSGDFTFTTAPPPDITAPGQVSNLLAQ